MTVSQAAGRINPDAVRGFRVDDVKRRTITLTLEPGLGPELTPAHQGFTLAVELVQVHYAKIGDQPWAFTEATVSGTQRDVGGRPMIFSSGVRTVAFHRSADLDPHPWLAEFVADHRPGSAGAVRGAANGTGLQTPVSPTPAG